MLQRAFSVAKIIMMKTFLLFLTLLPLHSLVSAANFNLSVKNCSSHPGYPNCSSFLSDENHACSSHPFSLSPVLYVSKSPRLGKGDFRIRKVVVDAGHGGKDSGCSGKNSKEKHIALSIALKLGNAIRYLYPEVEVIYTRETDVFIPLHERTNIANKNNADLFISIHCNYVVGNSGVKGTEVYVMGLHTAERNLEVAKRENEVIQMEEDYEVNYGVDPNSPEGHIILSAYQHAHLEQSILFAEKVHQFIKYRSSHSSRSVLQAGFHVLRETTMPSVLVESGYLSNTEDEAYLMSESGQDELVNSMISAFGEYKNLFESGDEAVASSEPIRQTNLPSPRLVLSAPTDRIPLETTQKAVEKTTVPETKKEPVPEKRQPESKILADPEPIVVSYTAPMNTPSGGSDVQYRVQLAASKTPLPLKEAKWQSHSYLVEVIEEGGFLKYQARNFSTANEAVAAQKELQRKGFDGAFVVAYHNGTKISLAEAKRLKGE